ncbi:hypothetical protein PRZ48_005783 [Zasmidium cellare]|uniref:CID domain-containing protein n=1 Tax=Zasmidium cellare TaxID=395010 RepID=A0ABR0ENG0_ZASCE|nr:hypothetical protein PRZ48_005783 [Zasmidium cellare]
MAYSDDAVKAKLAALNETQDSIVTVAQWIMFHRRHADRTASLWLNRLQESPSTSKRLNLIYLANEVVQQSRARSKTDFLVAFEPIIAEAASLAYKGASQDIQGKLRRVIEVWRERRIFDPQIQTTIEKRLDEIDKQKGGKSLGGGGGRLGGSLFGGGGAGVAPELEALNKSQLALSKAELASKTPVNTANGEYAKMTDPNTPVPSAPVRAAKLRGLVKDLMAAEGAVDASIRARNELIAGLEKLVESHRAKAAEEKTTALELRSKIDSMETTIRDVEDRIMRGADAPPSNGTPNGMSEPPRPETEGFTPPPPDVEEFTPPPQGEPMTGDDGLVGDGTAADGAYSSTTGADYLQEQPPNQNEPPPSFIPPPAMPDQAAQASAEDFLKTLMSGQGQIRQASGEIPSSSSGGNPGDPRLKRRKLNNNVDDEIFGAGVGGVDEEGISAMLGGQ